MTMPPTAARSAGITSHRDIREALSFAEAAGLNHDVLSSSEAEERFPLHRLDPGDVALYTPAGGVLRSNLAVCTATRLAVSRGAVCRENTSVSRIEPDGSGVIVTTDDGTPFRFDHVVVCVSHQVAILVPSLTNAVRATRITSQWRQTVALGSMTHPSPPGYRRSAQSAFTFLPTGERDEIKVGSDSTATRFRSLPPQRPRLFVACKRIQLR